jgi:hypothetical protein
MIGSLKAEFRKLLTIRSTYAITFAVLALIGLIATLTAYKDAPKFGAGNLQGAILNGIGIAQVFGGIVAILLITHEYRFNLIDYSLTITNRRIKLLLAKLVTITCYSVVLTLIAVAATWAFTLLGIHLRGVTVVPQHLEVTSVILKSLAYVTAGIWAGLLFGLLFRSVVMAIVVFFVLPTMVEPLLHNLLKVSSNYLPFSAQNQITMPHAKGMFSPLASLGVFLAYLAAGWVVALILFYRRDAN